MLCVEDQNLNKFIEEMHNTIYKISIEINGSLDKHLVSLRSALSDGLIKEKEFVGMYMLRNLMVKNGDEKKLYKLFRLIEQLFEKLIESDHTKSSQKEGALNSCLQSPSKPLKNIDLADEPGMRLEPIEEIPNPKIDSKDGPQKTKRTPNRTKAEELKVFERVKDRVRERFEHLLDDKNLNSLWLNLIEVLNYLGEHMLADKHASSSQIKIMIDDLQPLLESFFIIYKLLCDDDYLDKIKKNLFLVNKASRKQEQQKNNTISNLGKDDATSENDDILEVDFLELRKMRLTVDEMFLLMCQKNKKLLNFTIKRNINLLADSLSVIPKKMPKIIDFENKVDYFKSQLAKGSKSSRSRTIRMGIRRKEIFIDSFSEIMKLTPLQLRGKLHIEFRGEEGEDAGGLTREWFLSLSKEIFNPMYALFITSDNHVTYQPSPLSWVNSEHLRYFKFIGRVIGKALQDGHLLDAFFTTSFYKHMVGDAITYHDVQNIDPAYYNSLKWILENDVTDLGTNFCYEVDDFGQIVIKD